MSANAEATQSEEGEFPLQLVAMVAATLLAGKYTREPDPKSYLWVADEVVHILRACRMRLQDNEFFDTFRSKMAAAESEKRSLASQRSTETQELEKKYPDGMPWLKGLLFITGKRSETEALPPFKRWRAYERCERRAEETQAQFRLEHRYKISPDKFDVEDAEKEADSFRCVGFDAMRAVEFRDAFKIWYEQEGIKESRSNSGKLSAEKKRRSKQAKK